MRRVWGKAWSKVLNSWAHTLNKRGAHAQAFSTCEAHLPGEQQPCHELRCAWSAVAATLMQQQLQLAAVGRAGNAQALAAAYPS